ncbi:MAG TPA: hypothetical protein VM261_36725 [Kofleriaceae bacterium]|nr:hypothetical protein [Kofleriaceae bacterium]
MRSTALVVIGAMGAIELVTPAPADACMCDIDRDTAKADADALASHDIVFDGWVLRRTGQDGSCPLPPAPPARRGCFRVRIHQKPDCSPMTYPAARLDAEKGIDFYTSTSGASEDGVTELCGVKKGRYTLTAALNRWVTDPDGTLEHGIVIDFDPARPQSYSAVAEPGGAWIVVPVTAHKGAVAGQELVVSATSCPRYLLPDTAYRVFGDREPDGRIRVSTCSTRALTDDEIKIMVRAPAPAPAPAPAAPPPPPVVAPPRPARPSGGCTTSGGEPGLLAALLIYSVVERRRRARTSTARSSHST